MIESFTELIGLFKAKTTSVTKLSINYLDNQSTNQNFMSNLSTTEQTALVKPQFKNQYENYIGGKWTAPA